MNAGESCLIQMCFCCKLKLAFIWTRCSPSHISISAVILNLCCYSACLIPKKITLIEEFSLCVTFSNEARGACCPTCALRILPPVWTLRKNLTLVWTKWGTLAKCWGNRPLLEAAGTGCCCFVWCYIQKTTKWIWAVLGLLGPVHTGRGVQHAHTNYGAHYSQWECSHSLQATSKGLHANLHAQVLSRPVWTGPDVLRFWGESDVGVSFARYLMRQ